MSKQQENALWDAIRAIKKMKAPLQPLMRELEEERGNRMAWGYERFESRVKSILSQSKSKIFSDLDSE